EPSGEGDQLTYRNHSEEIEPRHFAEAGEGDPPLSAGSATRTGDPAGINPDHIQKSRREDESS
ncbi:MAG TPA: hypothetical protein VF221_18310, partial [Chloroflexota bacterium]